MACRLCLSTQLESIFIFSKIKIQNCIAKFLQLELSPDDPVSKVVCAKCWEQLDSFQKFFYQIEEAQESLKLLIEDLTTEDKEDLAKDMSPGAEEYSMEESIVFADDMNDLPTFTDEEPLRVEYTSVFEENKSLKPVTHDSHQKQIDTEQISKVKTEMSTEQGTREYSTAEGEDDTTEEHAQIPVKQKKIHSIKMCNQSKTDEKNTQDENTTESSNKFSRTTLAREHDAIIKKNMNLTCDICSIDLFDFDDLRTHFHSVHNRKGYVVCCKKKLKTRSLIVDHINSHIDPDYFKCQDCGKVMSDRFCMRTHMLTFHPTEELKTFQCSHCPEKLASQYLLDLHSIKHVPEDKCTFICNDCGKGFPTNSTLNVHIKRTHSTAYDRMCEICAKLFRHKTAFERHMEEHEGIVHPQVQCTECDSWLKDKQSLRRHMYNKHGNKIHICNICGKKSSSMSGHLTHIKYMHETEPVFRCSFCEKSFKQAVKLKEHVATHTGEVLYTCSHCPTTFKSKANMYSHRKKMHREEWEISRRGAKKEPKS